MNTSKLNLYIILTLLGIFIGYCLGTTTAHAYTQYLPPIIPDYKYQRPSNLQVHYVPQYKPRYNYQEYRRPTYNYRETQAIMMTNTASLIHENAYKSNYTYWKITNTPMGYQIKPY